jgi:hypothetical protein
MTNVGIFITKSALYNYILEEKETFAVQVNYNKYIKIYFIFTGFFPK